MSESAQDSPIERPFLRRAVALCVLALLAFYYAFVATHGQLTFRGHEPEWRLYDGMWHSLTQGRFDLDPRDAEGEEFIRDGKSYSYYGVFPAFVRGLAAPFIDFEVMGFQAESCALAGMTAIAGFLFAGLRLRLHRGPRAWRFILFILSTALATPIVTCVAKAEIYNEAVLWGLAWGCVFNAALVFAASASGTRTFDRSLLAMAISAGLTLHSRATVGFAVCFEMAGVLVWLFMDSTSPEREMVATKPFRRRPIQVAVMVFAAFLLAQAVINYGRWGNPFVFRPIRLLKQFQGFRGDLLAIYGSFRLDRVPTSACYYFLPEPANFLPHWPFIATGGRRCFPAEFPWNDFVSLGWQLIGTWGMGTGIPYYDLYAGPRMPLSVSAPALVVFAAVGALRGWARPWSDWGRRSVLLMTLSLLFVVGVVITFDTLALRFLGDLIPFLAGLGFLGLLPNPRDQEESAPRRRLRIAGFAALTAFSIFATHITMLRVKAETYGAGHRLRERLRHDWLREE